MKLYPECVPCMLQRAILFCRDEEEEVRYRVMRELCELFSKRISPKITTTEIAYERNKIIEGITHNLDPMKDIKEESIRKALEVYPRIERYVDRIKDDEKRFKIAMRIALAGNLIEFGARDHVIDLDRLEEEIRDVINERLIIDDTDGIYEKVKNSDEILYVTDNAGELVFDRILIRELLRYAEVIIAPLSRPVQDDAWIEDVKRLKIDETCKIVPRGDFIGIWFEKCTPEFVREFDDADLIIAKGMGCYETLVDYPERLNGRIALLMKAKCEPVAKDVNVPLGSGVIMLI
ncbi:MAG TPA: DUF89 family protein [Candidatus Altiarchaeales archaeon]|nr:DUF89 family protein [Candidatus Altiarchaeales archaeon]HEX55057.1 DUF89 family protein [Candidatus Altiarchaeales archaeon]